MDVYYLFKELIRRDVGRKRKGKKNEPIFFSLMLLLLHSNLGSFKFCQLYKVSEQGTGYKKKSWLIWFIVTLQNKFEVLNLNQVFFYLLKLSCSFWIWTWLFCFHPYVNIVQLLRNKCTWRKKKTTWLYYARFFILI